MGRSANAHTRKRLAAANDRVLIALQAQWLAQRRKGRRNVPPHPRLAGRR